jgi:NAD(P)-dependent dehydrogenase (short-subunit alcohol dehydrogenase family)
VATPAEARPKAALVTGAARRVGRALAEHLGRSGWAVAVHYNSSADAAQEVVSAIESAGGCAVALQSDLTDEAALGDLVSSAVQALGPLGLLVNNAAVFEWDDALSANRASWDRHLETNLRAPFVLTQAFARQLPEGANGHVVNLLDGYVTAPARGFTSYHLSKFGLYGLTRSLALELAPRIRVNGIGPGAVLPDHYRDQAEIDRVNAATPLGVGTDPAEICRTVDFLLGARSVTGQMIALDGGRHLGDSRQGDEL